MAQGVDSSPTGVYLTLKEFPSKFEDIFVPRNPLHDEGAECEVTGTDGRRRINNEGRNSYPGVGLLRMEFPEAPGKPSQYVGTAFLIANGRCVLTCAHNVVEYRKGSREPVFATSIWFQIRKNQGWWKRLTTRKKSVVTKEYRVRRTEVYPPYFSDPHPASGYDLALCWIEVPEDDDTVEMLYSRYGDQMPIPRAAGNELPNTVSIVGFPGEHSGQKFGMTVNVPDGKWNQHGIKASHEYGENSEIVVYDFIDTSKGQSGSPVMGVLPSDVFGVHVAGDPALNENWATLLTDAKLRWIEELLAENPSGVN